MTDTITTMTVSIDSLKQYKLKIKYDEGLTTVIKITESQAFEMADNGITTTEYAKDALKEKQIKEFKEDVQFKEIFESK